MSDHPQNYTQDEFELEFGPEIARYRRLASAEILRGLGFTSAGQTSGFINAAAMAFILSIPMGALAWMMGSVLPVPKDPFWGPVLVGWFILCYIAYLWYWYVLPRRAYLAIRQNGFVYQGQVFRRAVRIRDVVECHSFNNTAALKLVFVDGSRTTWKRFMVSFPSSATEQLFTQIERQKIGAINRHDVDNRVKRQIQLSGMARGAILWAVIVLTPVCCEKSRDVLHKAFGAKFCGMPSDLSVPLLLAVLFAPLVYLGPHLLVWRGRGMALQKFENLYDEHECRRSAKIVIVGGAYFVVLLAAWIIFASARGL